LEPLTWVYNMAKGDAEILRQFGQALIDDFVKIIPKVTGKTAASVRMEIDDEENILTIFGDSVLGTLEDGRGPTVKNGPGDVIKGIKEWIARKGLNISPFAVAFNIHKYGNTLHRQLTGVGPVNKAANPIGLRQVLTQQRLNSFNALVASHYGPKISSELLPFLKPA